MSYDKAQQEEEIETIEKRFKESHFISLSISGKHSVGSAMLFVLFGLSFMKFCIADFVRYPGIVSLAEVRPVSVI